MLNIAHAVRSRWRQLAECTWLGWALPSVMAACNNVLGLEPGRPFEQLPGEPAAECSSNVDCQEQGFDWPHVCKRGACVDITTQQCKLMLGAETLPPSPEPVIFGAFARFEPHAIGTQAFYWSFYLAMSEFIAHSGIPLGDTLHPPLMLLCHGPRSGDLGEMNQTLDHLVDKVHVPAIMMVSSGRDVSYAARRLIQERGRDVLLIHHAGASDELVRLQDDGLVWHMLGSDAAVVKAYVPLIERLERLIRRDGREPTRLAILDSQGSGGVSPLLATTVRINGEVLASQLNENYYFIRPLGSYTDVGVSIAELAPDIIVDLSSGYLLSSIDKAFRERGLPLPYYVYSQDGFHSALILAAIREAPTLRSRVVGVKSASGPDSTSYERYLARVQVVAPSVVTMEGTGNIYDMAYLTLYAAVAGGNSEELNGSALRTGLMRLLTGERHDVGPEGIERAQEFLASDPEGTMSLYGTLGPPNFDPSTGARQTQGAVWCIDEEFSFSNDVLRYDESNDTLEGEFTCFEL